MSTSATARGDGRQVKTVSEAAPTAAGESAQVAPSATSCVAAPASRSCTVNGKPAARRFAASGRPRLPSPMKPRRRSLGGDNDLPELGARLESGERVGRSGEGVLRIDERMDAGLLEEGAEPVELDDRPHR